MRNLRAQVPFIVLRTYVSLNHKYLLRVVLGLGRHLMSMHGEFGSVLYNNERFFELWSP